MNSCLLYVGCKRGLHVFAYENHQTLRPVAVGLEEYAVRGIAVHPQQPQSAYIGCALPGWGLYHTSDAGQTLTCLGFEDAWVWDVSFHPDNPNLFYVGTEPPMLYKSADGGESFQAFTSIEQVPSRSRWRFFCAPFYAGHIHGLGLHPRRPERLFAGVEHGALLYSHDSGQTWQDALVGYDVHRLIVDPANPDRVFAAAGEGLFVSEDAGQNWSAVPGMGGKYITTLIFDPQNPQRAYANAAGAPAPIYRTEDGGQSWQPLGGDLPLVPSVSQAAYGISLHPHQPDILFYGSDIDAETARIFVSLDRGEQWQPLSADLPKLWLLCAG
jgi:hypothetical protein